MQRVLVLGCCGAGKSAFSHRLAEATALPLIELDYAFWRPGWVQTPREDWLPKVTELCARDHWIMDGNYHSSLHIRLPRADTVIWLDYPRRVCVKRVLGRIARNYGRVRNGLPEGCPEKFDLEFMRYIWTFNAVQTPRILAALENFGAHAKLCRVKTDRDADELLNELSGKSAAIFDQPPRCA